MTSKEALKELYSYSMLDDDIAKQNVEIIKKELEVLEIIKTKSVDISLIKNCYGAFAYAIYNSHIDKEKNYKLTKEEFDLVKEWLENDK